MYQLKNLYEQLQLHNTSMLILLLLSVFALIFVNLVAVQTRKIPPHGWQNAFLPAAVLWGSHLSLVLRLPLSQDFGEVKLYMQDMNMPSSSELIVTLPQPQMAMAAIVL